MRIRNTGGMSVIARPLAHIDPYSGAPVDLLVREIDVLMHEGAKQLLAYWTECNSSRGDLVVGRDLPCASLKKILSSLCLLEPVDEGSDFRFRLAPSGLIVVSELT